MVTYQISSISQLHQMLGLPKPKHPMISLVDVSKLKISDDEVGSKIIYDFYAISLKDGSCGVQYGRNTFDFEEGVLIFTAPGQVYTPTQTINEGDMNGWMLFFHPDLIRATHLGEQMDDYTFFNYEVFEALHLSESEEEVIVNCVQNIKKEYEERIDNHSQRVIVSNIELLLNYCMRFYERQFNTRTNQSKGIVTQFETLIKQYFSKEEYLENGLQSIQYFAEKVHLSPHYLSDLLRKETGRAAKDHINDYVIKKAKDLLLGTQHSVSEIAYSLGFNYPHYFTRVFKTKTGQTPVEFRVSKGFVA